MGGAGDVFGRATGGEEAALARGFCCGCWRCGTGLGAEAEGERRTRLMGGGVASSIEEAALGGRSR